MGFEINIIGEIIPFQLFDMDGYINCKNLDDQLKRAEGKDIIVNIDSIGGDVDEGFMMYTSLRNYARDNNAKVTTYAKGRLYSIATVVFLAGDERIANKFIDPFVHNAWTYAVGDSKELNRVSADLEKVNEKIAKHYADHTDLTKEDARKLMDNDSYITPEEAVNVRFATKIEEVLRPVALKKIFNKKSNKMAKDNKKGLLNALAKALNLSEASNLEVYTSTSETIVFPDLEDGDIPKVGDQATVDGKAADGSYTLADGTEYVFESGELTEIKEVEEEEETTEEVIQEIENLKKENKDLKEKLSAFNKKVDGLLKAQKESDSRWNKLKSTVSDYMVDDKDNEDKGNTETKTQKKGLSGAANKLKEKEN